MVSGTELCSWMRRFTYRSPMGICIAMVKLMQNMLGNKLVDLKRGGVQLSHISCPINKDKPVPANHKNDLIADANPQSV